MLVKSLVSVVSGKYIWCFVIGLVKIGSILDVGVSIRKKRDVVKVVGLCWC